MKFVNFINNLIINFNSQHLLKNGAGKARNDVFNTTATGETNVIATIIDFLAVKLAGVAEFLLRILNQLIYFIVTLALNIMDFLMVVITEMSGQASDFKLSEVNTNLENADILFKFFFNSLTIKILTRVFYFSLLLLIIITIIAIVRNEWKRATDDNARDAKVLVVKALKSLFGMFLTPFIIIIGIVFSNVILNSAINALHGGKTQFSIGSVIFMSGTYNANWYRIYADNNDKIPILFDFNGGFYGVSNGSVEAGEHFDLDDEVKALKNNTYLTSGYSTYAMFQNSSYFTFKDVPEDSSYYAFYDGDFLKTKRVEYYVMADFVDYAMETGAEFYIKNVEDVYSIAYDALEDASNNGVYHYPYVAELEEGEAEEEENKYYAYFDAVFNNILPYSVDENGEDKAMPLYQDGALNYTKNAVEFYEFNVFYNGERLNSCGDSTANTEIVTDEEGNETTVFAETAIKYQSLSGAEDEAYGAKYLYCYKVKVPLDVDETRHTYIYVPVQQNSNGNSYFSFSSEYLEDAVTTGRTTESLFVARGGFNQVGYPTAIRQDGGNVVFYRHDAESDAWIKVNPQLSYTEIAENGSETTVEANGDFFSKVLEFDQDHVVSNLDIKTNSMPIFSKSVLNTSIFDKGYYTLNYSFIGTGLTIANVYDIVNINFVILIFACWQMLVSFFYMIFALMKRILELTVFWFTYPAWLTKFPIEDSENLTQGTAFAIWRVEFIDRVLCIYAMYIGMVFFYALVPVVMEVDFAGSIVQSARGEAWFSYLPPTLISWVIRTMFILVLFTMVEAFTKVVQAIIGGNNSFDINSGESVFSSVKGNVKATVSTTNWFSPFKVKDNFGKIIGGAKDFAHDVSMFIPGKAVADSMVNSAQYRKNDKNYRRSIDALIQPTRHSGATDANVDTLTKDLESVNKDYYSEDEKAKTTEKEINATALNRSRLHKVEGKKKKKK